MKCDEKFNTDFSQFGSIPANVGKKKKRLFDPCRVRSLEEIGDSGNQILGYTALLVGTISPSAMVSKGSP